MDLILEQMEKSKILDRASGELGKRGCAAAEFERDYRVALAKKELELKAENYPATLISDLSRGDVTVADLKFKRDCAEVMYKSCMEGINVLKLQIKILEEQIAREWGKK